MPRTPSQASLHRQLQELISRMGDVEATLKEQGHGIDVLTRWKEDTDFAKKLLEDYQEKHPEANPDSTINGKAWAAVLAALAALTAILLATLK